MLSCFRLPRPFGGGGGDADQQQAAAVSPRRGPSLPFAASLFAASPSTSGRGKSPWPPPEADDMESLSMLLDTVMGPGGEDNLSGRREEWMADLSQLFIDNKFASGANSRIYKQRAVAVKMVRIPERDEARRAELEEQFIAACKKPPVYCIITEYMSQGTLRMYLNKKDPYSLSPETILTLALDISRGMEYLHAQGVIHRDLKSQNLLLNDEMRVKVADFGTSCLETKCQATKGNKGTYRWMAPEMTKEKPYTRKVDVYSFGIVLWELTTCLLLFQGMTPVQAAYAASEKVPFQLMICKRTESLCLL